MNFVIPQLIGFDVPNNIPNIKHMSLLDTLVVSYLIPGMLVVENLSNLFVDKLDVIEILLVIKRIAGNLVWNSLERSISSHEDAVWRQAARPFLILDKPESLCPFLLLTSPPRIYAL
jgi:hypothetical protein